MNPEKLKIAVSIILAASAFSAIILLNPNQSTGLAVLGNESQDENSLPSNANSGISPRLSIQEVKETSLDARLLEAKTEPCPSFKNLSFEVSNNGNSIAERIFVKPSSNLKVIECINCNAKQLSAGEKITVMLKACRLSEETASISFSSINALEEAIVQIP